ncbi:MAG: flavin-containing monooxygenase, partial [Pseudomonadales bacterium]
MHFVADRCNMWPHIQLNTRVLSADFDEHAGLWRVRTADGREHTCRYFVSAMGMISEPVMPDFTGIDTFQGPCFHSARWPEGLDYAGKRVAIIGSGATTVQMLPVLAETAGDVTVFQRTANFVMPAVQKTVTPEWDAEIKAHYDEIIRKCRQHVFGMAFDSPVGRTIAETAPDEVQRILEEHWPRGSFRFVFETFDDLLSNPESNRIAGDFVIRKMLSEVEDPEVRDMLTPKGYPFFAKRPPLDHGYFKTFNRQNVHLVDINEREPIVEITPTGIQTTRQHYEFDIIVLATGFQAYTGAQEALPIRGQGGLLLKDKWETVSSSIMGVFVAGFPNLFMITGPQAPFANLPTSIEENSKYIVNCIKRMRDAGDNLCVPRADAEEAWVLHTADIHRQTLMAQGDKVHSWMMGANLKNRNPRVLIYFGGANVYYDKLEASAAAGFPEVTFERLS